MRTLVCGACAVIAIGLIGVSATLSYRFSYSLGGTLLEAHGYALAAAGVDILKGFLPFVIFLRLQEGRRLAAAAGLVVFGIGVVWSFTSAMGLAAQVRTGKVTTLDNRLAAYREAKAQLERIEVEQAKIVRKRSSTEIASEIAGKLAAAITVGKQTRSLGAATDHCARPTRWTAEACSAVWELRQHLAAAREWERLEAEAQTMRSRIEALRQAGAGDLASSDAQADFLARAITLMLGREIGADWMRLALVVLLGVLLEVGSSCGLYAALGSHSVPGWRRASSPSDDDGIGLAATRSGRVADYSDARLRQAQGSRLAMGRIQRDYEAWCKAHDLRPVARGEFLRKLREVGQGRGWSIAGGVIHHIGLCDEGEMHQ